MARVITFSRTFPAYHANAGKQTYFVEKFLNSIGIDAFGEDYANWLVGNNPKISAVDLANFALSLNKSIRDTKNHTIRGGKQRSRGDKFSPRVWMGKPYNSPQIIFAPVIEIQQCYDVMLGFAGVDRFVIEHGTKTLKNDIVAANDGLTFPELLEWFKPHLKNQYEPMQIICWKRVIY